MLASCSHTSWRDQCVDRLLRCGFCALSLSCAPKECLCTRKFASRELRVHECSSQNRKSRFLDVCASPFRSLSKFLRPIGSSLRSCDGLVSLQLLRLLLSALVVCHIPHHKLLKLLRRLHTTLRNACTCENLQHTSYPVHGVMSSLLHCSFSRHRCVSQFLSFPAFLLVFQPVLNRLLLHLGPLACLRLLPSSAYFFCYV